ncbi:MAG: DUF167 domain-containing protein [Candidatus Liptonbacteria bacterium]|nr:DUF167 domain-containing protein [Candidatus Liptonbacteria bacterium]
MKIFVRAKPNAKAASVEKLDDAHYVIAVTEPPKENKANFAIMEALARHFGVSLSRIRLISGRTSKEKTFEIL